MSQSELRGRLEKKEASLAVIGLGYVGLPVAALFAETGFDVLGVELRADRIEKINNGICPIEGEEPGLADLISKVAATGRLRATTSYDDLKDCDVILIDVETPVDDQNVPRYEALRAAIRSLGPVLKNGALVIVESTIAPGTIAKVVLPLLEQYSGRRVNHGFYLGHCPERVTPGRLLRRRSPVTMASTTEPAAVAMPPVSPVASAALPTAALKIATPCSAPCSVPISLPLSAPA